MARENERLTLRIYNGDCLKIMPLLPAKSVDMILCDLPYGVTNCHWDSAIPFEPLWQNYKRLIKDCGAIVLTATQPFATDLINSNRKWFKYELIWCKTQGANFMNANVAPLRAHENILIFCQKKTIYNPQKIEGLPYCTKNNSMKTKAYSAIPNVITNNEGDRFPLSWVKMANSNGDKIHPTQKPVALFEYLIKTYTNEGDIVLDNCAGSFTTGVACQNLGRHFIGIELDKEYYKIGKERMAMNRKLW